MDFLTDKIEITKMPTGVASTDIFYFQNSIILSSELKGEGNYKMIFINIMNGKKTQTEIDGYPIAISQDKSNILIYRFSESVVYNLITKTEIGKIENESWDGNTYFLNNNTILLPLEHDRNNNTKWGIYDLNGKACPAQ